jgi:hypothetical protein
MYVLVFVCVLGSMICSGPLVGTSAGQCKTEIIRSPTFGKPASKFVSGCEIYFFGEYLEPVEGPDGEMGYLIEKTDSAVTLNGRHFCSPYDPQRESVRPPSEEANRRAAIFEKAMEEIRRLAEAHPSLENAYFIDSVLYTDTLQPYTTESGDTVMLRFNKEWGCLIFEDAKLSFEIKPYPLPPKEERDKQGLDIMYHSLAGIRPGFVILIGRGSKSWYPLSEAPALKAALAKIPALAQRLYMDMYGDWIYDPLTIDGYIFGPGIVAEFAGK